MEKTTITSGDRKRTETGVIQFNQDWPGVFLRGDDAFGYAMSLLAVIAHMDKKLTANPDDDPTIVFNIQILRGLFHTLTAAIVDDKMRKGFEDIFDPPYAALEFPGPNEKWDAYGIILRHIKKVIWPTEFPGLIDPPPTAGLDALNQQIEAERLKVFEVTGIDMAGDAKDIKRRMVDQAPVQPDSPGQQYAVLLCPRRGADGSYYPTVVPHPYTLTYTDKQWRRLLIEVPEDMRRQDPAVIIEWAYANAGKLSDMLKIIVRRHD